jgi:FtsH-binding integral membrane protein
MFGELLAMLFGQNAAESLRDSKTSRSSSPGGDTDALSGAASALLGSVGLLIGLSATLAAFATEPRTSLVAIVIIAAIGFGCSYFGYQFGRRAPHVTRRFLGMAKYAVVVSAAGMILPVVSLVVTAARTFQ